MRWLADVWWRLIRFGFRLLYNEFAFTYDIVSKIVSLGAWRCWQRSALKHLGVEQGALVLELAHGTGDLQLDLHAAGYRTIGYDLSPAMGRIAKRKLARNGVRAVLMRGRAQQLPFADGRLAVVVTTFPTDFIFADDTLSEIYRILQAEGRLVIVPGGMFTGGGAVKAVLEWLYRITGQRGGAGDSIMERVIKRFEAHGFSVASHVEPCRGSVAQVIVCRKKV